ncbi:MAG: tetraacyldisaccharide 4'-kinase [Gammaproteobacteria bacterium]|nr:tetraacyldisaccharide 4'-kinase [Gammaproteobacteria bacterium]
MLVPFGWLYAALAWLRRRGYHEGVFHSAGLPVPVLVVGNLSVGGTGKTPFVIWLVDYLKRQGYRPGIVSRGYGGNARRWPQQVRPDSSPETVGDEPVLLARRCACPIAVGPDRVAAAEALLEHHGCDVIVADDGLQHYALERDLEIAIVDGVRRYGNGRCLPAGPLRESRRRLEDVDIIVCNGVPSRGEFRMTLGGHVARRLGADGEAEPIAAFAGRRVHAVAGIGNPARFFGDLRRLGLEVIEHPFPDHHRFVVGDLAFDDDLPVLMTEKDAVKCEDLALPRAWYVPVTAEVAPQLEVRLQHALGGIADGQKTA